MVVCCSSILPLPSSKLFVFKTSKLFSNCHSFVFEQLGRHGANVVFLVILPNPLWIKPCQFDIFGPTKNLRIRRT